ncbi:Trypsin-4 [Eumeta japonica]|uniref:Trypsin-4 n=1 Tax=Eumeta variegata TaxID=151549 RepID=A0A4C1UPR4_EUMVA|nr:Trypsin-4 [Eumeta japonica]
MHVSIRTFIFLVTAPVIFSNVVPDPDSSARIVNGDAVAISSVPYQAGLRRRVTGGWAYICGGVVVHRKAVVTAAHCIVGSESSPSNMRVVVGTSSRLSGGNSYDLLSIRKHSDYSETTLLNDIALLVTDDKMSLGSDVAVIPLAEYNTEIPAGTEALVSGFGSISYDGSASTVLLAAKVKIVSQSECSQSYLGLASIYPSMICAMGTDPVRDACQGDSGGPLVADGKLIGLVSFGEGCADPNFPGMRLSISAQPAVAAPPPANNSAPLELSRS